MSAIVSHFIIVGMGLLGTSLGLAVKKRGLAESVIGIDLCQETLNIAQQRGAVDVITAEFDSLAEINDGFAIICTPVRSICRNAERVAKINDRLLISDVGSTKGSICCSLDQLGVRYVGAHPIAGSEKNGPAFGNADLFQNRLTVLTPTVSSRIEDVQWLQRFWESLGSRVQTLSPNQHDAYLAKTSHLPHAIAASLASLVTEVERPFCGTGFVDTTRIASGSPTIWTDIFLENRLQLLAFLEVFSDRLATLKIALENNNEAEVIRFLESAHKNT